MSIVEKLVAVCEQEWDFFGRQEIDCDGNLIRQGMQETDERFWQRVGDYWRDGVGRRLTGRDTDYPWSAAFVSWAFRRAGDAGRFPASASHCRYIRRAILDRRRGVEDAPLWCFRLEERAPAIGDLISYARQSGVDFDRQPATYKSHADIVVAIAPGEIVAIGGNVRNSVTKRHFRADAAGRLAVDRQKWFAVLENRM